MSAVVSNILRDILQSKRREVAELRAAGSEGELQLAAAAAPPARDFTAALRRAPGAAVIAEIKRRWPSADGPAMAIDPADQARRYQAGGAAAISVLTDGSFFSGSLADLQAVRAATALPVLRKDFIIDPLQVLQARVAGADAVLLIAAALERGQLAELYAVCRELGMTPLVEVHHRDELDRVLALDPPLVGINNRDLGTLAVDINTCLELRRLVPSGALVVAESGIGTPRDVRRLLAGGLDAFLVGTALMRAEDPQAAVANMVRTGEC